jgi:hypothetical protein
MSMRSRPEDESGALSERSAPRRPRRGPPVHVGLALGAAAVVLAVGVSLALSSLLTSGVAPTPAAPILWSAILWSADTETGDLSQWNGDYGGGVYNTGTGEVAVDSSHAHSGRHSLRFSIAGADGTTGNQATRIFRWRTADGSPLPDDAYYSAWYLFPHTWRPAEFWNVFQWKTRISEDRTDPTFVLTIGNRPTGEMYFYLFDWITQAESGKSSVEVPTGRWVHIEARYRWSTARDGRVTFWQDGRQIIDVDGVQTMFPSEDPNARSWSLDNYTDGITPPEATIYADDAAISTVRLGAPLPEPAPAR